MAEYENKLPTEVFAYINLLIAEVEEELNDERETESLNEKLTHLYIFSDTDSLNIPPSTEDLYIIKPAGEAGGFSAPEGEYNFL